MIDASSASMGAAQMDLADIDIFLTLASELHFGRTADRVGVSQARVSRTIRSFETNLGGALFERTSRTVRLTPLGRSLHDALSGPYERLRVAFEDARSAAHDIGGVLRVGAGVTTVGDALTTLVKAFEAHSHTCTIAVSEVDTFEPYSALRANEIDVLVGWLVGEASDLIEGPVIEVRPRALAVASHHPLAKRSSVSVEDVAKYAVMRIEAPVSRALYDAFVPPCTPAGTPLRRTEVVRSYTEAVQLVALGRIVHPTVFRSGLFRRPDIVLVPIADLPPLPIGLIWCKAHENQRIRTFAMIAETFARDQARPVAT